MGICFWKWGILPHEFLACTEREKHIILGMVDYYVQLEEKQIKKASKGS